MTSQITKQASISHHMWQNRGKKAKCKGLKAKKALKKAFQTNMLCLDGSMVSLMFVTCDVIGIMRLRST